MKFVSIICIAILTCTGCDFSDLLGPEKKEETLSPEEKAEKKASSDKLDYEKLKEKRIELAKEFRIKKKEYENATGKEKESLRLEVKKLSMEGKNVVLQINKLEESVTSGNIEELKEKIRSLKEELAEVQKEFNALREWGRKLGRMSPIAMNGVCAWCNAIIPAGSTCCPGCGKTAISKVTSESKSDVDIALAENTKKMKPIKKKIALLESKIAGYRHELQKELKKIDGK